MAKRAHFLFCFLALVSSTLAAKPIKGLVTPISQTDSSSPFTITLNKNERFVVDVDSPFSWHHCPKTIPRVSCHSTQCMAAQSYKSPFCHLQIPKNPPEPAPCGCTTLPSNPISKTCAMSQLSYTDVSINTTDGFNPLTRVDYKKVFISCAPQSLLKSLPKGSSGVASLSKGSLSLVSQFSAPKVSRKFAMCLADGGVAFFGDGPFHLMFSTPGADNISDALSYTPLLKNPGDSLGYYIGLKGIAVSGQGVQVGNIGKGGIKISTIAPYSILRSDIYKAFISQVRVATKGVPQVPKVAPFDLCLNSTFLGSSRIGINMPTIDFQLDNGKNWSMVGFNSAKVISNDVACLAFVDGGQKAEHAMVMGLFQMQQNFVQFDLENSRLGYTQLVYFSQTNCINYNFTSGV